MENNIEPIFTARIIAEEKIRDRSRERLQLERTSRLTHLLKGLIRIFQ
ncbi:MAG: hypothetical protein ACP5HG_05285 [Anaerolineae bacterium]